MFVAGPAGAQPQAMVGPRYAATLVDASTGEVLYAKASDEARHPASITKVMTLFLAFDALSTGQLRRDDLVTISHEAATQKPSKLGLAAGKNLSVDEAIRIIAVKSANDVAVALAEKIAGSEAGFVRLMMRKAHALAMNDTVYANASGLADPANVTTARDIATLSLALLRTHPDDYAYFSLRRTSFGRQTFTNHNHLLGKVIGVDGIKTGYTVDAGYTLVASAVRGDQRLIAVVLGEPSITIRNQDTTALLEAGFSVINGRARGENTSVSQLLPAMPYSYTPDPYAGLLDRADDK